MKKAIYRCLLVLILGFPMLAEATVASSDYLFVWAMEAHHPNASTIGRVQLRSAVFTGAQ